MMKTNDKLAELIHSMTKSEKRYFKLFAQRHTLGNENKYESLFNVIDKQDEYNEEEIFSLFKDDPMINNFNMTKKRLYDQILTSLQQFHRESSSTTELNTLLSSIELLFKKGLYQQAQKKINFAKKIADKNDLSAYSLQLIQWETKLYKIHSSQKRNVNFEDLVIEEQSVVDQIQHRFHLENMKTQLIEFQKDSFSTIQFDKIDQIIEDAIKIQSNTNATIVTLEILSVLALANYIKGDKEIAIQKLIEKQDIYTQNPERIENNPSDFMSDLANLIHLECSNRMFNEAREHLAFLKRFPNDYKFKKTQNFDIRFFTTLYSLELSYNMYQYNFDQIVSKESSILENLDRYGEKLSDARIEYFYYMLAVAHFYLGHYKGAKVYSSKISNNYKTSSGSKIGVYNKWLEIFIQFELQNYDLVHYKIATTKKYLKKKGLYSKVDNDIFLTLSKIDHSLSAVEANEILEKHLIKTGKIDDQPTMQFSNSFFDYIAWMKSKTRGSSIKDQLKRA